MKQWKKLFELSDLGDIDKPLTLKILSNSQHPITKHLLYMYSMESFIYPDLNRACRVKDKNEIQYFGAFAAALSYIIYYANENRIDDEYKISGKIPLFRGRTMNPSEFYFYQ